MQEDLTHVLNEIDDPELGIGIVDLGLVYRADWNAKGIDVEFATTSPSCPFSDVLLQQINDILHHRFREAASIRVQTRTGPALDTGTAQRQCPQETRLDSSRRCVAGAFLLGFRPRSLEELDFLQCGDGRVLGGCMPSRGLRRR